MAGSCAVVVFPCVAVEGVVVVGGWDADAGTVDDEGFDADGAGLSEKLSFVRFEGKHIDGSVCWSGGLYMLPKCRYPYTESTLDLCRTRVISWGSMGVSTSN